MKKRIVGLETEYGILPFDEKDDKGMFEILAENLQGEFLPNGGLVYVEVLSNFPSTHGKVDGNRAAHPEYATPEILIPDSLKELIAYDKAGNSEQVQINAGVDVTAPNIKITSPADGSTIFVE